MSVTSVPGFVSLDGAGSKKFPRAEKFRFRLLRAGRMWYTFQNVFFFV